MKQCVKMATNCRICKKRCHADDGKHVQGYVTEPMRFRCRDCIGLMEPCRKCLTTAFYFQKFPNGTLYSCREHTFEPERIVNNWYECPQCGAASIYGNI